MQREDKKLKKIYRKLVEKVGVLLGDNFEKPYENHLPIGNTVSELISSDGLVPGLTPSMAYSSSKNLQLFLSVKLLLSKLHFFQGTSIIF